MWPYWLVYSLAVVTAFVPWRGDRAIANTWWLTVGIILTLFMGFRYEVGGDWYGYLSVFDKAQELNWEMKAPGYMLLNWASARLGTGITGVNLVCGGLFVFGLLRFVRTQPYPWVSLAVAIPFLLIVVAMGYSRQGVALGFLFLALSKWAPGNELRYIILIAIGAMFHRSLVIMFPFVFLMRRRPPVWLWLLGAPIAGLVSFALLHKTFEYSVKFYITEQRAYSAGGFLRVLMNVAPILFALRYAKRLNHLWRWGRQHNYIYPQLVLPDMRLWWWMGALSVASLPFVVLASHITDRIGIYFAVMQVALWPRIIAVQRGPYRKKLALGVVSFYGLFLYVWLSYAINSNNWVPYRAGFFG